MSNEIRNRRMDQERVKMTMARFETTISETVLKFKLMPSRMKLCVALSAVLSLSFYLYLASFFIGSDTEAAHESLLDVSKCPACFGYTACGMFYNDRVKMAGMSKFRVLDMINPKNVHFAQILHTNEEVVIKKTASDSELRKIDRKICIDAMRPEDCDVARVMSRTNQAIPFIKTPLTPDVLKHTGSFMFSCPSYRLLDSMWTHFQEYKKKNEIFTSDKMQVMYMSMVNPEPLLLQTFPKSDGWPFPHYHGACGRVVVEENAGDTLSLYYNSDFSVRAALAYDLMKIADTLTTKSDYALYLTDVSYENFAVDMTGKVTVIDLEHIIVVDKIAVRANAPAGWDEPHESIFDECNGQNCLSFSTNELCSHDTSDHNYYAICRNILSRYANEPGMPGGLLHDMPTKAADYWDLENLLNECAHPSRTAGRFGVKDNLMKALYAVAMGNKDHLSLLKGRPAERKSGQAKGSHNEHH